MARCAGTNDVVPMRISVPRVPPSMEAYRAIGYTTLAELCTPRYDGEQPFAKGLLTGVGRSG